MKLALSKVFMIIFHFAHPNSWLPVDFGETWSEAIVLLLAADATSGVATFQPQRHGLVCTLCAKFPPILHRNLSYPPPPLLSTNYSSRKGGGGGRRVS
jgi:hypothetical protein